MKADSKQNKGFLLLLSVASLLVWGIILKQLFWGITFEPDQAVVEYRTATPPAVTPKNNYYDNFRKAGEPLRNPFRGAGNPHPKKLPATKKTASQPQKIPTPALSYVGYLEGHTGRLAILEGSKGQSFICAVGDSIDGMAVRKIDKLLVMASYKGHDFELRLSQNSK